LIFFVDRTLAVVFGLIGVIFTVEAGKGCDFIEVEDTDGDMLDLIRDGERPMFVFGTATRMRVGIFMYEILEGSNVQGCVDYPQKFFDIGECLDCGISMSFFCYCNTRNVIQGLDIF
jgi:hypothetical protein